ncbi:IS200/IS605 family transposase [Sphingobium herbicidovorans]|nr:IS200/IS605 family transposase [Sphingobium herbicidovorans]
MKRPSIWRSWLPLCIRQVCAEMGGVTIVHGVLPRDHVHMFAEISPHVSVSEFVRRAKGRSSRKIQQEFEHIRKRYWGQRFWQRGCFSTTSGNITDDTILRILTDMATKMASAPRHDPPGVSRSVIQLPHPLSSHRESLNQIELRLLVGLSQSG